MRQTQQISIEYDLTSEKCDTYHITLTKLAPKSYNFTA